VSASNSKAPNGYSLDELLNSLEDEQGQSDESFSSDDPIFKFIAKYNLKTGENKVTKGFLYKLFKISSEEKLSTIAFTNTLRNYILYKDEKFHINLDSAFIGKTLYQKQSKVQNKKLTNTVHRKGVEKFIRDMKITKGNDYLSAGVLFYIYDEWRFKNKKLTKLTLSIFIKLLKLYIPHKQLDETEIYFGINRDEYKDYYTDEKIKKCKDWYEKYKERKKTYRQIS
jgi:hypothetical protein